MGFTALAFKLPAVFCYGLYVWTFYLLTRRYRKDIALTVVIFMVFCPPWILHFSTVNLTHWIIGILGNILFLLTDKIIKKPANNTNIFFLGLVIGFSIYIYSYSVIFITTVFIILILANPNWNFWRGNSSLITFLNPFKNCNNIQRTILRVVDIIIGVLFFGILFSLFFNFIWGGFTFVVPEPLIDFMVFILTPNNITTPLLLIYLVFIIVRIYLYRKKHSKFHSNDDRLTTKPNKDLFLKKICFVLAGFLIGFCPYILGSLDGQISGHTGLEINLSLNHMITKFMDIWVAISSLIGLNKPYIDFDSFEFPSLVMFLRILLTSLIGLLGIISFIYLIYSQRVKVKRVFQLKHIVPNPPLILLLLFLVIILYSCFYSKPIANRHLYPLYGILCFSVAIFIHTINKRIGGSKFLKICSFLWILFYMFETHNFYIKYQVLKGVHLVQRESRLEALINHLRSDNIKLVYSDYWTTHPSHFIGLANPEFVEYYKDTVRGLVRKERSKSKADFAFVFSNLYHIKVFEKIIHDYKITCQAESFGKFVIYKNFEGNTKHLQIIKNLPIDPYFT
jgi:hypothetical protein